MINVHAPTDEKDEETKNEYYEQLEEIFIKLPKYDIKVTIGDFNAKIGREQIYRPVIGKDSLHPYSNNNGEKLIEFACEHNLRIMGTFYDHRNIHKGTWKSPNGVTVNQIDHFLIESLHMNSVSDVRVYRGADVDSDHFLLVIKFKESICKRTDRKNYVPSYNMELFKKEKTIRCFQDKIKCKLEEDRTEPNNINTKWERVEEAVLYGAKVVETSKTEKRQDKWFDEECKQMLEQRKRKRIKMINDPSEENRHSFGEIRRKVKMKCRQKKRKYLEQILENMETEFNRRDIRKFYKEVKSHKRGYQAPQLFIEDEDGNLLGDTEEVKKRWINYFSGILNDQEIEEEVIEIRETEDSEIPDIPEPDEGEIREVIRKLKNNKSPGGNNISAEMLKSGGELLLKHLVEIIKEIWKKEVIPDKWQEAVIHPILKK